MAAGSATGRIAWDQPSRAISAGRQGTRGVHRAAAAVFLVCSGTAFGQWAEWGGPKRDFHVEAKGLREQWPDDGPRRLWERSIGEGYSGITADDGRLFTMCRSDGQEMVVALDPSNGKTLWEHKYDAPTPPKHVRQFGEGPRATPTVSGDRVYSAGVTGILTCLEKKTGKEIWTHKLNEEFEGTFLMHGYSSSPLVHGDLVIAMVGGPGHSIVAFNKMDGKLAWKRHDYVNSYSSPMVIDVDGQEQLLCFMGKEIVGLSPESGDLLWRYEHGNRYDQNICMPVWGEDRILFISSVDECGSRGLKLTRKGDKTNVEEVWHNKKVGVHHSNAVRIGDYIYTSAGGQGPSLLHAVNVKTGEVAWKKRGFSKATMLAAGDWLIVLDEDGNLGLCRATPDRFKVLAKICLLEKPAWTVPTLVGTRLYLRDKGKIMALDLG